MRYPYDADADSNGDIIVSQYNRDGVKKFVYASSTSDTGFGNNGISGKGNSKYEGNSNCKTSYSYSGEVYNDVFYTTAYYERSVVAIRASDGRCLAKYFLGGYPYNMTINQSTGILKVGHSGGYKTINLNNNQQFNCNVQTNLRNSYGTTVSGNYIYYYRSNRIYRAELSSGTGCPFLNSNTSFNYPEGNYVGLQSVGGNKIWTLSWSQSRMKKIQVNASGSSHSVLATKGSRSMSGSSASKLYFYYPWGLGYDDNNNRILAANLNNVKFMHLMQMAIGLNLLVVDSNKDASCSYCNHSFSYRCFANIRS